MSDEDNTVDKVIDAADFAIDVIRDNKEHINAAVDALDGGETDIDLSGQEPLREVNMTEGMVEVTSEVKDSGVDSVKVSKEGDDLHVEIGKKTLVAKIPDDIIMEEAEAKYNNGVLTVRIPRENEDDDGVDVEIGGDE